MTSPDSLCPPALRCIDDVLVVAERLASATAGSSVGRVVAWLRRLRGDAAALDVLEAARRQGVDLARLLLVASSYVGGDGWLSGELASAQIGPIRIRPECVHDIAEVLAKAEEVDATLGRSSDVVAELRTIKALLNDQEEDARRLAPNGFVLREPDGKGSWTERPFRVGGAFVAVTDATVGAMPKLGKGRGRTGDPTLGVLVYLIYCHVKAVSGCCSVDFATLIVTQGLGLDGEDDVGGPANPRGAAQRRLYRLIAGEGADQRERAHRIARLIRLPFQAD